MWKKIIVVSLFSLFIVVILCHNMNNAVWNPYFVEKFGFSNKVPKEYRPMMEDINLHIIGDTYTVNILQTVGDGKILHVLYEISFSQEQQETLKNEDFISSLSFDTCCTPFSVDGKSMEDILTSHHDRAFLTETFQADYNEEKGVLTCISSYYDNDWEYQDKEVHFIIGNLFAVSENNEKILLSDEVLSISWIAHNKSGFKHLQIQDGYCEISPLRLSYHMTSMDSDIDVDEIIEAMGIVCKDGSMVNSFGTSSGSSDLVEGKYFSDIVITPAPKTFFQISEISSVEINGVTFSIE